MDHIRLAEEKDLEQIKKLIDENISIDFYSIDYLRDTLSDSDRNIYISTDELDVPVALLYIIFTTYGKAKELLKIPQETELPALSDDSRILIFKTTCTDIHYRKSGILSSLMDTAEADCRKRGYPYIILEAIRIPSGKIPNEKGLQYHQFRPVKEILHPWADTNSYCPYCQNQFCQCNAVLYIKELNII